VITMSLTVGPSAAIDAALAYAWNTKHVFIDCAAGNSGGGPVGYPANNPNVVAVSSTGPADIISGFSSVGPEVELAAPGETIWSTRIGNTYGQGDGTSYAAPQVAGVAALLLSCDATLTHQGVRQLLRAGAVDLGVPGPDNLYGFGRIDALASLRAAGCRTLLRREVGLFVGGLLVDSSASYNSGPDIGFRYRNRFATLWSWESEAGVAFTDDGADDALLASLQLDVVRHLPGSPSVQPFVLAGVGVAHYNTLGFSDTGPLATLGLGVDYRWRPRIGFRLDLRALGIHDVVDPGWNVNGQVLWGTTFSF
jgi:subtilisin family serine protease